MKRRKSSVPRPVYIDNPLFFEPLVRIHEVCTPLSKKLARDGRASGQRMGQRSTHNLVSLSARGTWEGEETLWFVLVPLGPIFNSMALVRAVVRDSERL